MMPAAAYYAHKRCLDVGIRIINIEYITEAIIKLRVEWVYSNPKRDSLGILDTISIKTKNWHNWKRF